MCSGELKVALCEDIRRSLLAGRELTSAERVHAEACEVCADAVLETEIESALMTKPVTAVPEDFVLRMAMLTRSDKSASRWARKKLAHGRRLGRHIGRDAAVAWLLVMMAVVTISDPHWWTDTRAGGMTLMLVLAGEVVGIALWLGLRHEA